jgi:hypothetical protein
VNSKERSYRTVATFLDSDENFMIYRRFGYLHARILLRLQDRLRNLESKLDDYDKEDADDEIRRKILMSRDTDEAECKKQAREVPGVQTRTQLLDEIEVVLGTYSMAHKHTIQSKCSQHGRQMDIESAEDGFP